MRMMAGSWYIPDDNKTYSPLGEDAHFISHERQTIGVADGVGGWARKGVDAGKYARQLMINSLLAVQSQNNTSPIDPKRVLTEAYYKTREQGSSTACIVTLIGNWLHAANVGDSGFVIIRDRKVIYRSPVQQHKFNCPYQLGNTSKKRDHPNYAEEIKVAVEVGDIIIVATDGLFDNVCHDEMEEIVNMGIADSEEPEEIAELLAEYAELNAVDDQVRTPFMEAAEMAGKDCCNGKEDDITVIVARIVPSYITKI